MKIAIMGARIASRLSVGTVILVSHLAEFTARDTTFGAENDRGELFGSKWNFAVRSDPHSGHS